MNDNEPSAKNEPSEPSPKPVWDLSESPTRQSRPPFQRHFQGPHVVSVLLDFRATCAYGGPTITQTLGIRSRGRESLIEAARAPFLASEPCQSWLSALRELADHQRRLDVAKAKLEELVGKRKGIEAGKEPNMAARLRDVDAAIRDATAAREDAESLVRTLTPVVAQREAAAQAELFAEVNRQRPALVARYKDEVTALLNEFSRFAQERLTGLLGAFEARGEIHGMFREPSNCAILLQEMAASAAQAEKAAEKRASRKKGKAAEETAPVVEEAPPAAEA